VLIVVAGLAVDATVDAVRRRLLLLRGDLREGAGARRRGSEMGGGCGASETNTTGWGAYAYCRAAAYEDGAYGATGAGLTQPGAICQDGGGGGARATTGACMYIGGEGRMGVDM